MTECSAISLSLLLLQSQSACIDSDGELELGCKLTVIAATTLFSKTAVIS